jgi:predicted enzyme related to lactoylglutathione lyase
MTYFTLHHGDLTAAGVLQMNEKWVGVPPHWMPYFAVADTDASVARALALGGQVPVPPFDTPYGRMAVVNDPQGATFSIMQPVRH